MALRKKYLNPNENIIKGHNEPTGGAVTVVSNKRHVVRTAEWLTKGNGLQELITRKEETCVQTFHCSYAGFITVEPEVEYVKIIVVGVTCYRETLTK